MKKRKEREQADFLPDAAQIEAEIKEAEAKGLHKEPLDPYCEPCMVQAAAGHLDYELKPSIEDLSR